MYDTFCGTIIHIASNAKWNVIRMQKIIHRIKNYTKSRVTLEVTYKNVLYVFMEW